MTDRIIAVLTIRGDESGPVELENYANFLRDLVFVYDRLWMLGSKAFAEAMPKVYYSSFFYTRGHRPIPTEAALGLVSAVISSPFKIDLNINTNIGESADRVARAFVTVVRALATLPALIRREELQNRLLEATVNEEIRLMKKKRPEGNREPLADAGEALRSLPGLQANDSEGKLSFLTKDMARVAESPLKIRSVEEHHGEDKLDE